MKKIIFIVLLIVLLSILFLHNNKKQELTIHSFKGIIIDNYFEDFKMMIKHDEVPGFMMEMTMMFNIDSAIKMNNFAKGDSIHFNFYISKQKDLPAKTWANELTIMGQRGLLEEEEFDDFFSDNETISTGEKLSDATFLDFDYNEVKLSQFNGKLKFISFIFSRCPMPNFCPAIIWKNQYLIHNVENDNVEFIIISFDHKYDNPQVLKNAYGDIFSEHDNMHILSSYGLEDELMRITTEAGLGFSGINDGDPRDINHTLKSLLIDPNGVLIDSYSGDDWKPKEVEEVIKARLKVYNLD